jgi:hypothetical protein
VFIVPLYLCLLQVQDPGAPGRPANRFARIEQRSAEVEEALLPSYIQKQQAMLEEQDFTKRFNALVSALTDFASSYNAGTVNVRKAKAVRKALRDLQKSQYFRPTKGE